VPGSTLGTALTGPCAPTGTSYKQQPAKPGSASGTTLTRFHLGTGDTVPEGLHSSQIAPFQAGHSLVATLGLVFFTPKAANTSAARTARNFLGLEQMWLRPGLGRVVGVGHDGIN
jgi:hypothetical protein